MVGSVLAAVPVGLARELAEELLAGLPRRWRHTIGVARRAADLASSVSEIDRDTLVAAAWLHDIGYAVVDTGFHPLDGARYLDRHGWPARVAALVAHHSGARFTAAAHGLGARIAAYPHEDSPVSDALAYADQTTGPEGEHLPIRQRMAEMLLRHGTGSPQARVHTLRGPYLLAAADRVEHRLAG